MFTCNIIVKIKDYYPKTENIPYQNFTCVFTSGDNEFQIPLVSEESDIFQYQMKNITSDIKYKVHVLDHNDMSLIGMCDMVISYDILNQLTPPNGFVQEQQKILLMDPKTKRKLFGSVMNAGDIYLNLYSEIYLCKKSVINNNGINNKKKLKNLNKKFDVSPNEIKKNKFLNEANSDRHITMNKNNYINISKNDNNNSGGYNNINTQSNNYNNSHIDEAKKIINSNILIKSNNSFNFKDKNNNTIKQKKNNIINKSPDKNGNNFKKIKNLIKKNTRPNLSKKTKLDDANYLPSKNNIVNKSDNNIIYSSKNLIPFSKKAKSKSNKKILAKIKNENLNDFQFNNTVEKKITTIESLENIDHSGKKYITTKKFEDENHTSEEFNLKIMKNANNNYNSAFTINSTEHNLIEIDKELLGKREEINNIFQTQNQNNYLKNNNNGIINDEKINNNLTQEDLKNNFIKLIDFYSLLTERLLQLQKKTNDLSKKSIIYKEKLFNELKKNNHLTQNKTVSEIENINIKNKGEINEKYVRSILKIKKSEFKTYQNIFNFFYYEYDIMKFKESEKNKMYNQQEKIKLLINVFQTLLKTYGNISQIYVSNNNKKQDLKKCFAKYGVIEKNEGVENLLQLNENGLPKNENTASGKINNQKDLDNKFRVIKEEDEDEFEDEGDGQKSKYKENIGYSNEKNKEIKNAHKKICSNISDNNNFEDEDKNIFIKKEKEETPNKKYLDSSKKKESNIINDDNKENEQNNEQMKPKIIISEENINSKKKLLDEIIKVDEEKNENNFTKENISKGLNQPQQKKLKEENESNKNSDIKKNQDSVDEEDLIMQKLLIEEFPKKCKDENLFVRINKYEYQFGKEIIKVDYENGDVVLKLDEGDYKLEEFIEILNDGKENEENNENKNEEKNAGLMKSLEDTPIKNENSSNKKDNYEEENTKSRKRRKHKIDEDSNNEEERTNNEKINNLDNKENIKKDLNAENKENNENNENKNNNCCEKNNEYAMRRRRRYYINGK